MNNSNLQPIFVREKVIQSTRRFFEEKHFHEVITPVFNRALPVEPNIYPFSTQWNTSREIHNLYLTTSPESGLKKMIAQGIGNCYSIGKCCRNLEGSGSLHLPEFLMLEWYRENASYRDIMTDMQELIISIKQSVDAYLKRELTSTLTYQGTTIQLEGEWKVFSMVDLFKEYAGLDFAEILEDEAMIQRAQEKGYTTEGAPWGALFDQIFVNEIEHKLPKDPFFIIDYPARLSPLCKRRKDNPDIAERFEFFMFGMEIGNGNNENIDYELVEKRFKQEQQNREEHNLLNSPIDYDFIDALKKMAHSGKEYAGTGFGIDRLSMIMADVAHIQEIELLVR